MLRFVIVALAGCQSIYGVDKPLPVDAAPPDGPWTCPVLGSGTIVFSKEIHEYVARSCTDYQRAELANRELAMCSDSSSIEEAEVGADLHGVIAIDPMTELAVGPRVSPEGDELWIHMYDIALMSDRIVVYARASDGTWSRAASPTGFTFKAVTDRLSAPTRRDLGARHVMVYDNADGLTEYVEGSGGSWTVIRNSKASDLAVDMLAPGLWMSSDGLRMIFGGFTKSYVLYYADRDRIDDKFRPGQLLPDAPFAVDPFLTDNCGQLFVSGLGAVFYAPKT